MDEKEKRIMIVEDEPKIAAILEDYLRTKGGYLTTVVERGDRVLTQFHAQQPDLARLFPHEAQVHVPKGKGLARLRLPPEVLEATRGDLADVRLFDAEGGEVPFLLDSARRPLWLRVPRREARAPLRRRLH